MIPPQPGAGRPSWPGERGWLDGYAPSGDQERRDLVRLRELLASGEGENCYRRDLPLHVTGSAVVVHPPSKQVLLRWHEHHRAWLQVGGHGDEGDADPFAVALREAVEETGLDDLAPWPGRARPGIVHVEIVPVAARRDEPAHEHADVRYVLGTANPDAARPETPAAELRWVPVKDAVHEVRGGLAETLRRVAARM